MDIRLFNNSVSEFFRNDEIYFIPSYQRNYSWESSHISDFINDIDNCLKLRNANKPKSHFLGGIVSVEIRQSDEPFKFKYEIIDGQQRLVTFSILAIALHRVYTILYDKLEDGDAKSTCRDALERIKYTFIYFKGRKGITHLNIRRLKLSKTDDQIFDLLINNKPYKLVFESHERIDKAYKKIEKYIKSKLSFFKTNEEKLSKLLDIEDILSKDFQLINIITSTRDEAYDLFQVLNDRGISLTDSDLIKAKVLEAVQEDECIHNSVYEIWTNILKDKNKDTRNYLRWIYSSYTGKKPNQRRFHKDFEEYFFRSSAPDDNAQKIDYIHSQSEKLLAEIEKCRKFFADNYYCPYDENIPKWKIEKINTLLSFLDNTVATPILLSATLLSSNEFYELIEVIEIFFFRYRVICNGNASKIADIYNKYSLLIREGSYKLKQFKEDLKILLEKSSKDELFESYLRDKLKYTEKGRSNQPIKYFLIYIDYYWDWYKNGAMGIPKRNGANTLFDLNSCTIEHVYSRNSSTKTKDEDCEPLKHDLGNLLILDRQDNIDLGNKKFADKKNSLSNSLSKINKEIANYSDWNSSVIEERTNKLIDAGLKIFSLN